MWTDAGRTTRANGPQRERTRAGRPLDANAVLALCVGAGRFEAQIFDGDDDDAAALDELESRARQIAIEPGTDRSGETRAPGSERR